MTINELIELISAKPLTKTDPGGLVSHGYVCDLLSWVMSHAAAKTAWITVQTHLNVVAVATLLDLACVIIPENITVDEKTLAKADEEGVVMLSSPKTAYEIAGLLYKLGVTELS